MAILGSHSETLGIPPPSPPHRLFSWSLVLKQELGISSATSMLRAPPSRSSTHPRAAAPQARTAVGARNSKGRVPGTNLMAVSRGCTDSVKALLSALVGSVVASWADRRSRYWLRPGPSRAESTIPSSSTLLICERAMRVDPGHRADPANIKQQFWRSMGEGRHA